MSQFVSNIDKANKLANLRYSKAGQYGEDWKGKQLG